jgi:CHRD domain
MNQKLLHMICALSLGCTASLLADDNEGGQFKADLSGYQEVPTLSTASSGQVNVMLSADQKTITVTLTFTKLEGTATSAGLFFGATATVGGMVAPICGTPKPSCPTTADGTVTTTISANDVLATPGQGIAAKDIAALVAALENGAVYANVLSSKYVAGEIRGQLGRGFGPPATNPGRGHH